MYKRAQTAYTPAPNDYVEDDSIDEHEKDDLSDKDNIHDRTMSSHDAGSRNDITEKFQSETKPVMYVPSNGHDRSVDYSKSGPPKQRGGMSMPAKKNASDSILEEVKMDKLLGQVKGKSGFAQTSGISHSRENTIHQRSRSFDVESNSLIPFRVYDFAFKQEAGPDNDAKPKFSNDPLFLNEFYFRKKQKFVVEPKDSELDTSKQDSLSVSFSNSMAPHSLNDIVAAPKARKSHFGHKLLTKYSNIVRKKELPKTKKTEEMGSSYIFKKRPNGASASSFLPDYLDIIDNEEKQLKSLQTLANPAQYCPVTQNPNASEYTVKCAHVIPADKLFGPFNVSTTYRRPTAIAISKQFVILAGSDNKIYQYSIHDNPISNFEVIKDSESGISLTCLDISENEEFLAIGVSDGRILIWNLTTYQRQFKLREHKTSIISIRIFSANPMGIVSSDIDGNTVKATFRKELFLQQVDSSWIFKKTSMVTNIIILNRDLPTLFTTTAAGFSSGARNNEIIAAMASFDAVYVIVLDPVVRILHKVKRPYYVKKDCNPVVTWASGVFNSKRKKVNNYLVIGWGTMLFLVELSSIGTAASFEMVGHLPMDTDSNIVYVSWISTSLIFIIDEANTFMVVSLESFFVGEYDVGGIQKSSSRRASVTAPSPSLRRMNTAMESEISTSVNVAILKPIAKVFKYRESLDVEVLNQKTFHDNFRFDGFHNTVGIQKNEHFVIVLMHNAIKRITLLSWNTYLESFAKSYEWLQFLTLAVDIYRENLKELADIPLREEDKTEMMYPYFRQKLLDYMGSKIKSRSSLKTDKWMAHQALFSLIDTSLELNLHDFLYNTMWDTLETYGCESGFLRDFEYFIKMNRVDHCPISVLEKLLGKYRASYRGNKRMLEEKYRIVELLLINLSMEKCEDFEELLDFLKRHNFIMAMIQICLYSNDDPKHFATPFHFLVELYEQEKLSRSNKVEKVGYKIFWFLRQCFKGKLGFKKTPIIAYKWELIITEVVNALFSGQNLLILMEHDTQMLINTLLLLFKEENASILRANQSAVQLVLYDRFKCRDEMYNEFQTNIHFQIFWLVTDLLMENAKHNENKYFGLLAFFYGNLLQMKDYDEFFLDTALCITLVHFLVRNPLAIKDHTFIMHFKFSLNNLSPNGDDINPLDEVEKVDEKYLLRERGRICMQLIRFIEKYLKKAKIVEMINYSRHSPLLEVTSYLHFLIGESKKSLQVYLENPSMLGLIQERIFEWIDFLFESMRGNMDNSLREIKIYILKKIYVLIDLSVTKTKKMISRFLRDAMKIVMQILERYPVQFKAFMDSIFENVSLDKGTPKKTMTDNEAIGMYIFFLCKSATKQDHEKLDFLLKTYEYPVEDCLLVCQKYNIKETWAHLEELNANLMKALKLRYQVFFENVQDFINNGNVAARSVALDQLDIMLDILKRSKGSQTRKLLFWALDKLTKINGELSFTNVPASISTVNQHIEGVMEAILYEIVMTSSTSRILQQIIQDLPQLHFLRNFYHTLLANYYHEGHLKDSIRNIAANEINVNTNKLKRKGVFGFLTENNCSVCHEPLDIEEDFGTFSCGHIFHKDSCLETDFCPVCKRTELTIVRKYQTTNETETTKEAAPVANGNAQKIVVSKKVEQSQDYEDDEDEDDEDDEDESEDEEEDDGDEDYIEPGMRKYYHKMFKLQEFDDYHDERVLYMHDKLLPAFEKK